MIDSKPEGAADPQAPAPDDEMLLSMCRVAEFRGGDPGFHVERIARLSAFVAFAIGLDARMQARILRAAALHDIGKLVVPDHIVLKPARLSAEEYALMQLHTRHGHEILSSSPSGTIRLAAEIALTHHERWDGTGYPNRLIGHRIPIAGRIVAVADVFEALVTPKPHRPAWGLDAAAAYLQKQSGRQFDPRCVDAMVTGWPRVMEILAELPIAAGDTRLAA